MAFPSGNIYYGNAITSTDVVSGQEQNEQLVGTEPALTTIIGAIGGGESGTFITFTAEPNDPNLTTWPSGDYIAQVNVSILGADVSWGLEINRVNSSGTVVETLASVANNTYTTASVQTLTWSNASAKTVSAGDRLQIAATGVRSASHGNQDFDIDVGTGNASTTTKLTVPASAAPTRRIFTIS